jgi:hypothetical protein
LSSFAQFSATFSECCFDRGARGRDVTEVTSSASAVPSPLVAPARLLYLAKKPARVQRCAFFCRPFCFDTSLAIEITGLRYGQPVEFVRMLIQKLPSFELQLAAAKFTYPALHTRETRTNG